MKLFVRVRGGLGNQMFQYAYAYLMCRDNGFNEVVFDIREYNNYFWPFSLNDFRLSLDYSLFSNGKLEYDHAIREFHLFQKMYAIFHDYYFVSFRKRDLNKNYVFSGVSAPRLTISKKLNGKDCYMYGYFQNAEILNDVRDELCKEFSCINPKTKKIVDEIKNKSVAISVRLETSFLKKDKLDRAHNTIQSKKYYFNILKNYIKADDSYQLIIFSNDIERVKKEFEFSSITKNIIYVENYSPSEQIEIMKHCKDFIISNSTFCWWGAYLGSYLNDGKVYSPRYWYDERDIKQTDLFFKEMIIVDD